MSKTDPRMQPKRAAPRKTTLDRTDALEIVSAATSLAAPKFVVGNTESGTGGDNDDENDDDDDDDDEGEEEWVGEGAGELFTPPAPPPPPPPQPLLSEKRQ